MKITKFTHSCLLVEMPAPVNRTAIFDPGEYSNIPIDSLEHLDDIIVTHLHADHMDIGNIKALLAKFPQVRITAPADAVTELEKAGIAGATSQPSEGISFFSAPHEGLRPMGLVDPPQENGVHYLGMFSHAGDSHHFSESMPILAVAVNGGPWGSTVNSVKVALEVKPKYIIPIHDWSWKDEMRVSIYDRLEARYKEEGITFIKPVDGEPFAINL